MDKKEKQNIVKKAWTFMNKSPILSAVLISILAVLGSQIYKIYTYIYWLPYFKLFEVPTYYFENALFDKYEVILATAPAIIVLIFVVITFDFFEKKIKLDFLKKVIFELAILLSIVLLLIVLSVYGITLSFIWINDVLLYIVLSISFLMLKNLAIELLSNKKVKITVPLIIISLSLIFVISSSMVYIDGYNSNVVDTIYINSRTIDDNKFVVFETSTEFYVIPCEMKDDNSIKIYRDSYCFIDKEKQTVTNRHFSNIYNEYNLSLDDAKQNFISIEW